MHRSASSDPPGGLGAGFTGWIGRVRDRLLPTSYVDWSDVPDGPQSPYRARLALATEHSPDGGDLLEREVVRGKMKVIYEVRCGCGRRWFNPRLERVQLCPRCDRAVVIEPPA